MVLKSTVSVPELKIPPPLTALPPVIARSWIWAVTPLLGSVSPYDPVARPPAVQPKQ